METLKDVIKGIKHGASSFYLKEGPLPLKVIRLKDITEDGTIHISGIEEVKAKELPRTKENLLSEGDILISMRHTFRAILVPKEAEGFSFSGDFIALIPDSNKIHPELLAAYLSQPAVLNYFEGKSRKNMIKSINKEILLDLPIRTPEEETQKKLRDLLLLLKEHRRLAKEEERKLREIEENILTRHIGE